MRRSTRLKELEDRLEIDEVLNRYVTALDNDDFVLLQEVFTPDAHVAFPEVGLDGEFRSVFDLLARHRPDSKVWLHLVGNRRVQIEGDRGSSVSSFFFTAVDHSGGKLFTGGEYRDKLARTAHGWRIAERIEIAMWSSRTDPVVAHDSTTLG